MRILRGIRASEPETPEDTRVNASHRPPTVLDSFSTRFFIRTAADLEPDVILSMLLAEDNWDRLPRPGFTRVPA